MLTNANTSALIRAAQPARAESVTVERRNTETLLVTIVWWEGL